MPATASRVVGTVGRRRVEPNLKTYSGRLAARVRELRDQHGIEAVDLAAKVGVELHSIYAYETGRRAIPTDLLPKLAKALKCESVADLLPPK